MSLMSGQNILSYLKKNSAFKDMQFLMQRLIDQGYEIYWAGGCVRDALLGRTTNDFDFATNALPEAVEKLFSETLDHGKKYGTITVLLNGHSYEITTYRADNVSKNHRHPESVIFSETYTEDSSRRDFTINALYADINGDVFDPQKGLKDLDQKIIRSVGEAKERFTEDALRMYRALRFSCQLDFTVEKSTFESIKKMWFLTQKLSKERRYVEFKKTILSDFAAKNIAMIFSHHLHPKLISSKETIVSDVLKLRLSQDIWSSEMRFRVFMLDWLLLASDSYENALKNFQGLLPELAMTREESKWISGALKFMFSYKSVSPETFFTEGVKYFKFFEFNNYFTDSEEIKTLFDENWLAKLQSIIARYSVWPTPLVNAKDLLRVGIKPGPQLGVGLQKSFQKQIEDPKALKKDILNWIIEELKN